MTDYNINTRVTYLESDGSQFSSNTVNVIIGSADTDDGFWNVGDGINDQTPPTVATPIVGWVNYNGHVFLMFEDLNFPQVAVYSPTAEYADFPAKYSAFGPLETAPLALCFLQGTRIATSAGLRAVEELTIGDLVETDDGRHVPIRWVGRMSMNRALVPFNLRIVRIPADTFAPGCPKRDLCVTADHGLLLDGVIVNAGALVGGNGIGWLPPENLPEQFALYHVETEDHEVIVAEGMPSESFIDAAGRRAFDNYQEFLGLYGVDRVIPEMQRPRIASPRLLPAGLRRRLGIPAGTEIPALRA
ncbi:Hint domain-containing protein [Psychromarinibacter sp. S121]|uniref:Hint domain-containing protein n=1 Tax=Psychromarinibacter sp. S121 TaxID=3415127 RepID=UPI003C7B3A71